MCPGSDSETLDIVLPLLQKAAAKAPDGTPCVAKIGTGGAGSYALHPRHIEAPTEREDHAAEKDVVDAFHPRQQVTGWELKYWSFAGVIFNLLHVLPYGV